MNNENFLEDYKNPRPKVSIVLGSFQRIDFLKIAIKSIKTELRNIVHEIIVIDGGSTDGTIDWLLKQKDILLLVQHNRGEWEGKTISRKSWGYFMNLGFKVASGKFICMLSDDCLLVPGAIVNGIFEFESAIASGKKIGAGAFYWRNWPEQSTYQVGLTWGDNIYVNHGLYLNEALQAINYADELSYIFYHADGDICLRLREASYETIALSNSFVEHFAHAGEAVRMSNNSTQKADWNQYRIRWALLGEPSQDWMVSSFVDQNKTYKSFLKLGRVRFLIYLYPIFLRLKSNKTLYRVISWVYKKTYQ